MKALLDKDILKGKIKLGEIKKIRIMNLTYIEIGNDATIIKKNDSIFIKNKENGVYEKLGVLFHDFMDYEDGDYDLIQVEYSPKSATNYTDARSLTLYIKENIL